MAELYTDNLIPEKTLNDVFDIDWNKMGIGGTTGGLDGSTLRNVTLVGGSFKTSDSGARLETFPEWDKTIGMIVYDSASAEVFKIIVDGTNEGDVTVGDYSGGAGLKYDKSAGTFDVKAILSASSLHIPDQDTTANSFHTNTTGDSWWGATETDFNNDNDNATAYILKTGVAKFQSITVVNATVTTPTITGGTLAIGSANNIFKADSNGIYLGNATFGSAPFRVTMAGALVATSAIITGTIQTSSSGQRILIDGTNNLIRFYDSGGVDRGTIYGIPTGIGITGDIDAGSVNLTCYHLLLNDAVGAAIEVTWNNSVDIGTTSYRFKDLYLGGNLVVGGLVDGVDIAAHDGGAITTYHTGTIGSTMHGTLTGIPSAHHTKTTSLAHSAITGITASQHHSSTSNGLAITPSSVNAGSIISSGTLQGVSLNATGAGAHYIQGTLNLTYDLKLGADRYIKRLTVNYVRLTSTYFDMYKPIGMYVLGSDPANRQGGFFFSSASGRFRGNDTGGASWRDICFYDERNDASPIPTFKSGLEQLRQIKSPIILEKEGLVFDTDAFPKEFQKIGNDKEKHTNILPIIGMLIQGQKELLEKVEKLNL